MGATLSAMIVRAARPDDAHAIATIHVEAWQMAYRHIVPSAFLKSLSIEQREVGWRRDLEQWTCETWVAEEGDQIVGWISAAASRDADASPTTGEVWAIYVTPSQWRHGVGRLLWNEAERYLNGSGFSEVTLWVLKGNTTAIAFYESIRMFVESGSDKTIIVGGTELLEIRLRKRLIG